jgi:hypothetical protein
MGEKDYRPTQATDEHGNDRGVFDSPFLAEVRAEFEGNVSSDTNGQWTFSDPAAS